MNQFSRSDLPTDCGQGRLTRDSDAAGLGCVFQKSAYWNKSKSSHLAVRVVTDLRSERWRSGGSIHQRDNRVFCTYFYASRPILELPEHCTGEGEGVRCTLCLRDVLKVNFTPLKYNVNLWVDLEDDLIFEDVLLAVLLIMCRVFGRVDSWNFKLS